MEKVTVPDFIVKIMPEKHEIRKINCDPILGVRHAYMEKNTKRSTETLTVLNLGQ